MADARFDVPPSLRRIATKANKSKKALWGYGLALFAFYAATQIALLCFLLHFGVFAHSDALFRICLGLLVFFVLADAVYIMGLMRIEVLTNAERKIGRYEKKLHKEIQEYETMQAEMRRIAQLRHDARNHLQVIASLESKGEHEAAHKLANSVAQHYLEERFDA